MSPEIDGISGPAAASLDHLDALSIGLAMINTDAVVLTSNAPFRRMAGIENGSAVVLMPARADGSWAPDAATVDLSVTTHRVTGADRAVLALQVFPLRPERAPATHLLAARRLSTIDPSPERLTMLFGFTPREAEIAQLLVAGHDPKSLSRELHIATTTTRAHLRSLFRKTGTGRQAALVALLASALAI